MNTTITTQSLIAKALHTMAVIVPEHSSKKAATTLVHHSTVLIVANRDATPATLPRLLAVPRWRSAMVLLWCSVLLLIVYLQHASLQVRNYMDVVAWCSAAFAAPTDARHSDMLSVASSASQGLPQGEHSLLRQLAQQSYSNQQAPMLVAQQLETAEPLKLEHPARSVAQLKPRS